METETTSVLFAAELQDPGLGLPYEGYTLKTSTCRYLGGSVG